MGWSGKGSKCWRCKNFHKTLSKIKDKFKKGFSGYYFTTDFEEKESNLEDIEEEDDNEMEGYQSSLDGSDDNFNFNNDYNDDA